MPTSTFDSSPPLDLICLPGSGVVEALADLETVDFIRRHPDKAPQDSTVLIVQRNAKTHMGLRRALERLAIAG